MNGTSVREKAALIESLRARIPTAAPQQYVPVPDSPLTAYLPHAGLPRGAVTRANDCALLVVELLAHASTAGGATIAVVGWPELSYDSIHAAGGNLDAFIAIPDPGSSPARVVALLLDAVDLIVYPGPIPRPLLGKLRASPAALLTLAAGATGTTGTTAEHRLRIDGRITAFHGIGAGVGRIRSIDLDVATHAGDRLLRRGTITLGKHPTAIRRVGERRT